MPATSSHYITLIGRYQHGQTPYFTSCRHSGCGLSIGFLQRVSTVEVLSVAVTLQITDLWYQRRSDLDNQLQSRGFEQGGAVHHHHFRYGQACASVFGQDNLNPDEEDLFVRDTDAFDDLEAREPLGIRTAGSVHFIYL